MAKTLATQEEVDLLTHFRLYEQGIYMEQPEGFEEKGQEH